MRTLFGGLCCVTFLVLSVAILAEQSLNICGENSKDGPVHSRFIKQDQAQAVQLITITSSSCPACERFKETLQDLQEEGYLAYSLDYKLWKESVRLLPCLCYFNVQGEIVDTEYGYRTVEQVKRKLRKL